MEMSAQCGRAASVRPWVTVMSLLLVPMVSPLVSPADFPHPIVGQDRPGMPFTEGMGASFNRIPPVIGMRAKDQLGRVAVQGLIAGMANNADRFCPVGEHEGDTVDTAPDTKPVDSPLTVGLNAPPRLSSVTA